MVHVVLSYTLFHVTRPHWRTRPGQDLPRGRGDNNLVSYPNSLSLIIRKGRRKRESGKKTSKRFVQAVHYFSGQLMTCETTRHRSHIHVRTLCNTRGCVSWFNTLFARSPPTYNYSWAWLSRMSALCEVCQTLLLESLSWDYSQGMYWRSKSMFYSITYVYVMRYGV